MKLEPGRYFAIVRQLPDPNDSGTYYVRAEIRNAEDDTLIERVELIDRGNRRFSKKWQVYPNVPSEGLYISILTTVYTDSGYTTKSDLYAEEMETYQVKTEPVSFGGGGGSGVSADMVRKIVREETLGAVTRGFEDMKGAMASIEQGFRNAVATIVIPEQIVPEKPDLSPIMAAIKAIHIPTTDLSPVLEAIGISNEEVFKAAVRVLDVIKVAQKAIDDLGNLSKSMEGMLETLSDEQKDLIETKTKIAQDAGKVVQAALDSIVSTAVKNSGGSDSPMNVRDIMRGIRTRDA